MKYKRASVRNKHLGERFYSHEYKIYLLNLELLFQVIQFCIVTSKFVYFLLIFIRNMNIWILQHIKETVMYLTPGKRT